MVSILIVDDSAIDRQLMDGLLSKESDLVYNFHSLSVLILSFEKIFLALSISSISLTLSSYPKKSPQLFHPFLAYTLSVFCSPKSGIELLV